MKFWNKLAGRDLVLNDMGNKLVGGNPMLNGGGVVVGNGVLRGVMISIVLLLIVFSIGMASAGVGIKWDEESFIVREDKRTCLTYGVYNPWPDDSYAIIGVSEELDEKLNVYPSESVFVGKDTSSDGAVPIVLCFEVENVYGEDCLFKDLFCERKCDDGGRVLSGEVLITEVNTPSKNGQSSAVVASVSAPLEIDVECTPRSKNLSLVYFGLGVICFVVVLYLVRLGKSK